jgi:hypothetical protein
MSKASDLAWAIHRVLGVSATSESLVAVELEITKAYPAPAATLTPVQLAVLRYWAAHQAAHGVWPTLEAAGTHFGRSKVSIYETCGALVRKGFMVKAAGGKTARSLMVASGVEIPGGPVEPLAVPVGV